MPPTRPTVVAFWVAWVAAWPASVPVATPTAVPAAATSAVSRTAVPVAVSQPKNADPTLTPPKASFCRATTARRSTGRSASVSLPALVRTSPSPSCWLGRSSGGTAAELVLMAVEPFCSARPPRNGAAAVRTSSVAARGLGAGVDVDLLLADIVADRLLVGHRLLVEADPLDRHGLLGDDRPLLAEGHLVLLLGDVRAGQRGVAVALGDRLALHPDLLAGDRDGDRLLLGGDVLAQPGPARRDPLGADVELLLGAGHGLVGRGAGGVVADRLALTVKLAVTVTVTVTVDAETGGGAGRALVAGRSGGANACGAGRRLVARTLGVAGGAGGGPGGGAVVRATRGGRALAHAVVAVQLRLLGDLEVAVRGDAGRVLDLALGVRDLDAVRAVEAGVLQRHEGLGRAEQAGVHRDPARRARRVVQVHLAGLANLVAGVVIDGRALNVVDLVLADHACSFVRAGWLAVRGCPRLS